MLVPHDPLEQTFVGILSELGRRRVSVAIQAEHLDGLGCHELSVGSGGESPPAGWRDIHQLGQHFVSHTQ